MRLKELKLVISSVLGWALVCLCAVAEDWPEFRGPTGQGLSLERELPVEWSNNKNVTWKIAISGLAWSSPVVRRGRVYLTTALTNSASGGPALHAMCLESRNGKVLWDVE